MNKKHFIALAETIKNKFGLDRAHAEIPADVFQAAQMASDVICEVARADNPRFDERRFRLACGLFV